MKHLPNFLFLVAFCSLLVYTLSLGKKIDKQEAMTDLVALYSFTKHSHELLADIFDDLYRNIQENDELKGLEFDWIEISRGFGHGNHHLRYELTFNREIAQRDVDLLLSRKYQRKGYTPKDHVEEKKFPFLYDDGFHVVSEKIETELSDSDNRKLKISYKAELYYK